MTDNHPTAARVSQTALVALVALAGLLAQPPEALARPTAPEVFCEVYPEAPECQGRLVTCDTCHTTTFPPGWNAYGLSLFAGLGADFEASLPDALAAVEEEDSDEDGLTNLQELLQGTAPGDKASAWVPPMVTPGPVNPRYQIGFYDAAFAMRRVGLIFCGQSPDYETLKALGQMSPGRQHTAIHDLLDECLGSEYWLGEALPSLGDNRIRPVHAVGWESPVNIQLADYMWDYRLFVYALSGDRDMRDLLLAEYHVEEVDGKLKKIDGLVRRSREAGPQPLPAERRAGMITTQWFFVINTMFSALPRTTAAQAYRAYLGADISAYEGIRPVPGEPRDVDKKGVGQAECASCHSTLDPLSYAFASYHGITGINTGLFDPGRAERLIPGWDNPPSVVMGQEVADVVAWAQVAAESDDFKRTMTLMFFRHALQRSPGPSDAEEFAALWRGLPEDGYVAEKLLHRLIDTQAFGRP